MGISLPWVRRIGAVVSLTMLTRLVGFFFPVIVLREMGQDLAGLAYFFINTAYFVVQPVSGGPTVALIRPVAAASTDEERSQWVRAALAGMVPAVTLAAVIGVLVCVTSSAPVLPMLVMVIGLSADAMYFAMLTARRRYTAAATYRLISNIGQLAILVVLFAVGIKSVPLVVLTFASSYVFGFAVIEPRELVVVDVVRRAAGATAEQRQSLFRTMVPTVITGFAYACITGADTYLVRLHHPELVARYGAAKTLAMPFILVSLAVATVAQPEAARASHAEASNIRRQIIRLGLTGGLLCIVACWTLAPIAAHIVYGHRYPQVGTTLRWLGTGTTLLGLHSLLQVWCWGRGAYVTPLKSLASGAAVAIAANLILVPRVGAPGAGVAYCLGAGVALALVIAMSRKTATETAGATAADASSTARDSTRVASALWPPVHALRELIVDRRAAALMAVIAALVLGYVATQLASIPLWEMATVAVAILATYVCVRHRPTHPLGLFPLLLSLYFFFGAQNWVSRAGYVTFRTYVPTNAVLRFPVVGVAAYSLCAVAVLWLWKRPTEARTRGPIEMGGAYQRAGRLLLVVGLLGCIAAVARHGFLISNPTARSGGPGVLGTFAFALVPAGVLLTLTARKRWIAAAYLIGTSLAVLVTIGFRTDAAILILACVICGGLLHRFRGRAVVAGLIGVLVLAFAVNTYRLDVSGNASVYGTKVVATGPLTAVPGLLPLYYSTPHEGVAVFNTLVQLVPSVYPHTDGALQLASYETAIPHRVKRPDSRTIATEIVEGTSHPTTTLTPTILGGPYVDFGMTGIIVEMGILGVLMAALYRKSQTSSRPIAQLAYAYTLGVTIVGVHVGLLDVQFVLIVPLFTAVALWFGTRTQRAMSTQRRFDLDTVSAS